jgi:pyruvate-formate lyase
MNWTGPLSRRAFLASAAAAPVFAGLARPSAPAVGELRQAIVDSPVSVALHRARVYTRVFQQNEAKPWIVRKGMALREYFETVPLYIRPNDQLAGSISETPGAMPVMAEIGIAENSIYTGENPKRRGYMKDKVPVEIREYWMNRNLWGLTRTEALGEAPWKSADQLPSATQYKFVSCQGHLSPSYKEVLSTGLGVALQRVRARRKNESDPEKLAFLEAAEHGLTGVSTWIRRYGEFLGSGEGRTADQKEMARIATKISTQPPTTFREALQLVWFLHQAVHIEGHGYSCTPDHIDQILLPYFEADKKAGRIDDAAALRLCENFILKQYDNTVWGPEHHLTQGLCVGGSTTDGRDLTNRLSWLFIEGGTNMALPEPLIWIRWHPRIDQEFFDFCLSRLAQGTCFPMMWNDKVIPAGLMELGVSRDDAYNYIPVGCNELAVPGQFYFNPGAHANYIKALELAMTSGKGYRGNEKGAAAAASAELKTFEQFTAAFGTHLRNSIQSSYDGEMKVFQAQMKWGQTPLTSCFFEGCVERGRDMILGTKYNILTCGGIFFANAVDGLAAIREVVYDKKEATLEDVTKACAANFKGYERLRAKLLAAPKHGNDDPRLDDLIGLVERLRDEPMKQICRDPRDGTKFSNGHVVRSSAVRVGASTPATPDGRLAGTPLASSVASSVGCEKSGPTAVLNSVAKLNGPRSWQGGYQVNLRFQGAMLSNKANRDKVRAMLNVYFHKGGQELQVNAVDTNMLRAAQKNPAEYRDLVVRIAGFSEFFVNLTPAMQEEIIARTAHM